jgi:hypothetical protein
MSHASRPQHENNNTLPANIATAVQKKPATHKTKDFWYTHPQQYQQHKNNCSKAAFLNILRLPYNSPPPFSVASLRAYPLDTLMKNLKNYVNSRRNSQLSAISQSESGAQALQGMQEKLHLAGDELQRMEDEGGNPLTDKQAERVDSFFTASNRLKKALRSSPYSKTKTATRPNMLTRFFDYLKRV